jgi:hypothetical protein
MKLFKTLIAAATVALAAAVPTASHATLTLTVDDLSTAGVDVVLNDTDAINAFLLQSGPVGSWSMSVAVGSGNGCPASSASTSRRSLPPATPAAPCASR